MGLYNGEHFDEFGWIFRKILFCWTILIVSLLVSGIIAEIIGLGISGEEHYILFSRLWEILVGLYLIITIIRDEKWTIVVGNKRWAIIMSAVIMLGATYCPKMTMYITIFPIIITTIGAVVCGIIALLSNDVG